MCEIDMEPCEVWVQTAPVAKKEYPCECCAATIRPGERYYRTFTIFEGDAATAKHCAACQRDIRAFAKAHESGAPHPHGFDEILYQCIDDGTPTEVRRWRATLARIKARRAAAPPAVGRAREVVSGRSPQGAAGPRGPRGACGPHVMTRVLLAWWFTWYMFAGVNDAPVTAIYRSTPADSLERCQALRANAIYILRQIAGDAGWGVNECEEKK